VLSTKSDDEKEKKNEKTKKIHLAWIEFPQKIQHSFFPKVGKLF